MYYIALERLRDPGSLFARIPGEPVITVLMATRNCADILEGVLDSYTRLAAPPDGWQVVIVDNGSTDSTPEVVRRFADRLPVTYVLEPQAGKSRAVNAGLRRVTGDLILFTDDDILPPAGWLRQYSAAAASQPDYDVSAGPQFQNGRSSRRPGRYATTPLRTGASPTQIRTIARDHSTGS